MIALFSTIHNNMLVDFFYVHFHATIGTLPIVLALTAAFINRCPTFNILADLGYMHECMNDDN